MPRFSAGIILTAACFALPVAQAEEIAEPTTMATDENGFYLLPTMKIPSFKLSIASKRKSEDDDDDDDEKKKTELTPTIEPEFGVTAEWRGYRASLTLPIKRASDPGGVKTSYRDIKIGTRRGMFGIDIGYESYRGFNRRLSSSDEDDARDAAPAASASARFADLFFVPYGDDLDRVKKAQLASEDEHELGWSPVVEMTYAHLEIDATGGIAALGAATEKDDTRLDHGTFDGYGAAVGGALATSWRGAGFYMSITTGSVLDHQSYTVAGDDIARADRERHTTFRMDLDYIDGPWRGGIAIMVDDSVRHLRDADLSAQEGVTTLYFGRALGSP